MVKIRTNTEKKLISFSKLELIDKMVKDEAEINRVTESAVIEAHLLDSMLPTHPEARFWTEYILYSEGGIGETLQAIFEEASAGINFHAKYTNTLPIIKWAKSQECLSNTIPTGKEPEMPYCRQHLKYLAERLQYFEEKATDWQEKHTLRSQREFAEHLYTELCEEPEYSRYSNIYQLIINNWEIFADWQLTYRLLANLAAMEKGWHNTAQTRTELLKLLTDVSADWED